MTIQDKINFLNELKENKEICASIKVDSEILDELLVYMRKWRGLLNIDGHDTKTMVRNDIGYVLEKYENITEEKQ